MPLKQGTITGKSKSAAAPPGGGNTAPPTLERPRWVYIKEVPIFDAHSGTEEDLEVDFTPEVLAKIIKQNNARIADTGDLIPVTKGHTGGAEEPEVLGWACNFRMGKIGKDKRAAIMCDMQFKPDKYKAVEEMAAGMPLPRRSIELWTDDLMIDPIALTDRPILDTIALLGADRPARNLGLGQKTTKSKYTYSVPEEVQLSPEDMKSIIEALTSLPEWQYLKECMDGKEKLEEEDKADMEEEDKAEMEEDKAEMEEEEGDEVGAAKLRLQRDQLKRKYARLQADLVAKETASKEELKTLFAKVNELERKERIAQRKAELMQIEAEGYSFDMADELTTVADMEPAQFNKHVARMKKLYRKAPVNVNIKAAPVPAEGGLPGVSAVNPREVMAQAALKAQAKYNKESK